MPDGSDVVVALAADFSVVFISSMSLSLPCCCCGFSWNENASERFTAKNVFGNLTLHAHTKKKNSALVYAEFFLLTGFSEQDIERKKKKERNGRRVVGAY